MAGTWPARRIIKAAVWLTFVWSRRCDVLAVRYVARGGGLEKCQVGACLRGVLQHR
eukprot:COSAG01_NODE_3130_length_6537_cov_24.810345_7_plen_55_part_01